MIPGLMMMLVGAVLLYLAVVDTDLKVVADQFMRGVVIKRDFSK